MDEGETEDRHTKTRVMRAPVGCTTCGMSWTVPLRMEAGHEEHVTHDCVYGFKKRQTLRFDEVPEEVIEAAEKWLEEESVTTVNQELLDYFREKHKREK